MAGIMAKFSAAFKAARYAWSNDAFDTSNMRWDNTSPRMLRYYLSELYYTNQVFTDLNSLLSTLKLNNSLYKHIRGYYNPVHRLVEGYVAYIYGGVLDDELRGGAIPIDTTNARERQALINLYRDGFMSSEKSLYARYAAKFGDGYWKVIDDPDSRMVWLETLDPRNIEDMRKNSRREIDYIRISYTDVDDDNNGYIYTEVITPETFETFKDDTPFGYNGNPPRYPNPYGFVPITHAKFTDVGRKFGLNAFEPQMNKIMDINDLASLITDSVRNVIQPIYHAQNVAKGALTTNRDEITRDFIRIVYTQGEGALTPLLSPVDIQGAIMKLDRDISELEADLPVLSLQAIRQNVSQISAVAIRTLFGDAIKRIEEAQGNLDEAMKQASAMAIAIGGMRGLNNFSLNYYTNRDYDFTIRERNIIDDGMTQGEIATILSQMNTDNPITPLLLDHMDFELDAIDATAERAEQNRLKNLENELIKQAANGLSEITTLRVSDSAMMEDNDNE